MQKVLSHEMNKETRGFEEREGASEQAKRANTQRWDLLNK